MESEHTKAVLLFVIFYLPACTASRMWCRVTWQKFTDVSEERNASVWRVEEQTVKSYLLLACSSETSYNFQLTTRCHIPEVKHFSCTKLSNPLHTRQVIDFALKMQFTVFFKETITSDVYIYVHTYIVPVFFHVYKTYLVSKSSTHSG
jgi:hypothetical protein